MRAIKASELDAEKHLLWDAANALRVHVVKRIKTKGDQVLVWVYSYQNIAFYDKDSLLQVSDR